MILSDVQIHEALDDGRLVITPEPSPRVAALGGGDRPYDSSSVNLTLGRELQLPKEGMATAIDFRAGDVGPTLDGLYERINIPNEGFILKPNRFILGITEEEVRLTLPNNFSDAAAGKPCLAARVEGKSSRARFGLLIHFTAPTIHAGFPGHIALEIMNLGPSPIVLYHGMPICQLIIEEVLGTPSGSESRFDNQTHASGAR